MVKLVKNNNDLSNLKDANEIKRHVVFIEGIIDICIRVTPKDSIMWKVFSDVKNRLDRIKYLNEELDKQKRK